MTWSLSAEGVKSTFRVLRPPNPSNPIRKHLVYEVGAEPRPHDTCVGCAKQSRQARSHPAGRPPDAQFTPHPMEQ